MSRKVLAYQQREETAEMQRRNLDGAFAVICGTLGFSMILTSLRLLPFVRLGDTRLAQVCLTFVLAFCIPGFCVAARLFRRRQQPRFVAPLVLALNVAPIAILLAASLHLF